MYIEDTITIQKVDGVICVMRGYVARFAARTGESPVTEEMGGCIARFDVVSHGRNHKSGGLQNDKTKQPGRATKARGGM